VQRTRFFSPKIFGRHQQRLAERAALQIPDDLQGHSRGDKCVAARRGDNSCSAFSRKLDIKKPSKLKLRWRWKIDGVVTNGSERDLKTFDHAARVVCGV